MPQGASMRLSDVSDSYRPHQLEIPRNRRSDRFVGSKWCLPLHVTALPLIDTQRGMQIRTVSSHIYPYIMFMSISPPVGSSPTTDSWPNWPTFERDFWLPLSFHWHHPAWEAICPLTPSYQIPMRVVFVFPVQINIISHKKKLHYWPMSILGCKWEWHLAAFRALRTKVGTEVALWKCHHPSMRWWKVGWEFCGNTSAVRLCEGVRNGQQEARWGTTL